MNLSEEVEGGINILSAAQRPEAWANLVVKFTLGRIKDENVCSLAKHGWSPSASPLAPAGVSRCQVPLRLKALTNTGHQNISDVWSRLNRTLIPGWRSYKRSDSQADRNRLVLYQHHTHARRLADAPVQTHTHFWSHMHMDLKRSAVKTRCSAKDHRETVPWILLKSFLLPETLAAIYKQCSQSSNDE